MSIVIDSELHHNVVHNNNFLPESSMKIRNDPLVHNNFRLMYVSAKIHHQQCCVMCCRNVNCSATTYFCWNCTVLTPNPSNRVPKSMDISFPRSACSQILETFSDTTISLKTHYIPSELDRNITEPGDNSFNHIQLAPIVMNTWRVVLCDWKRISLVVEYWISCP